MIERAWKLEMDSVREKVSTYRPPLPKKRQRVRARAERSGSVKVFTKEEIEKYIRERSK
jgi:hypothetical protein